MKVPKRRRLDSPKVQAAKLQSIGELAASFAHEISNPLTSIDGYVFQMLREIEEQDRPSKDLLRNALDRIKFNVDRMSSLTKAFRTFSRQNRGADSLPETLSVSDILQDTLTLVQSSIKHAGINLDIRLPAEDVDVRGHFVELTQILVNLLMNARDACQSSTIRNISVGYTFTEKNVCIFVEDSGTGIEKKIRKKIFDAFFTTKASGQGTGLGLSISKAIAERHKGQLKIADSSEKTKGQKGSRFELHLPRHQRDALISFPTKDIKKAA